jgi:xylitol oxidase
MTGHAGPPGTPPDVRWNWSGSRTYAASRLHRPASVDEVQTVVAATPRLKPLGTRHSFNDIADFAGGDQIDLTRLPPRVDLDTDAQSVTISAGTRYGDIATHLDAAGYALENLASLPHCTVIGSVATATHGSGQTHRSLASAVSAVDLVAADGELRRYTRDDDPDLFPGVVVGLGALGVVTALTLDLVPRFEVAQYVYEGLDWDRAAAHFDELQGAAYSVSLFTNWADPAIDQVWMKHRLGDSTPPAYDLYGARRATRQHHPAELTGAVPDFCTEQLGVAGPWYERLPHFQLRFTPSYGDEIQTEYLVPRRHALAALDALRGLADRIAPLLIVAEIRTIAADDLWMSPFYREDCAAFHFTWQLRQPDVESVLPMIERALAPLGARPHWGKLFDGSGDLDARYPRLPDFRSLVISLDPNGKFRSPFVDRVVFGEGNPRAGVDQRVRDH